MRPLQGQGLQARRHGLVLDQGAEDGQRPLLYRRLGERRQGRPDLLADGRRGFEPRLTHRLGDPFGGPGAFVVCVDPGQGLEREGRPRLQRPPTPAGRQGRRTRRTPLVEEDHSRARIAKPLQGQERQQDALARSRRSHDHGVADVADMEHQPKGRGARSAGDRQRRPVKAGVPGRTGPDRRHRQEVGEIQGRDQGAAYIGVGFARQGA
ncbi:hypothetical protein D3C85_1122150 [compost metagenome]